MNHTRQPAVSIECVACGVCVKTCPLGAMAIYNGVYALPDHNVCVGCGKCAYACPACIISMVEKGGVIDEEPSLV